MPVCLWSEMGIAMSAVRVQKAPWNNDLTNAYAWSWKTNPSSPGEGSDSSETGAGRFVFYEVKLMRSPAQHSTAFWNYSPCTCFVKHCRGFKLFPAARYSTFLRSIKVDVWWPQIRIFKSELQTIIFPELNRFQTGWNWSMNSTELLYTQMPELSSTELGLENKLVPSKNSERVHLYTHNNNNNNNVTKEKKNKDI